MAQTFFRSLNFVPNFGFGPARSLLLDQTFFVFASRHALYMGGIWYLLYLQLRGRYREKGAGRESKYNGEDSNGWGVG